MAIKYLCDSCNQEINNENGIINNQEITIEMNEKKISILISVSNDNLSYGEIESSAICHKCFSEAVVNLATTGRLYLERKS